MARLHFCHREEAVQQGRMSMCIVARIRQRKKTEYRPSLSLQRTYVLLMKAALAKLSQRYMLNNPSENVFIFRRIVPHR